MRKETPGGESLGVEMARKSDAKMDNQKGSLAVYDSGKFLARSISADNTAQPFHREVVVRREPPRHPVPLICPSSSLRCVRADKMFSRDPRHSPRQFLDVHVVRHPRAWFRWFRDRFLRSEYGFRRCCSHPHFIR